MSFEDTVRESLDKRINLFKDGMKDADPFDSAVLSVMIGVLIDIKKEIGLE